MGTEGLWDILKRAGQSRSLAHLAVVDGFESNASGKRAYRIGINASTWLQRVSFAKGGENPELRLLFFRLRHVVGLPILPLFVFDGREKPKVKQGSQKGKNVPHPGVTAGFKKLLDCFGVEWRMARGEAEAELGFLNSSGVIDAVMTDDADAFVFGATCVIKDMTSASDQNNSAVNSEGKASKTHVTVYTSATLQAHRETRISRLGFILYALLVGGEYADGVQGFGTAVAHALARSGFGEQLVDAFEKRTTMNIGPFLQGWRAAVHNELETNVRGFLPRQFPSLQLPDSFPDMEIMEHYVNPVSSARYGGNGGGALRDTGEMSLPRIAAFCEEHFIEWGYERAIIKRFRDLIWPAAVMRLLRRAALEADGREGTRLPEADRSAASMAGPLRPKPYEGVDTLNVFLSKYFSSTVEGRRAAAFANQDLSRPPPNTSDTEDEGPLLIKVVGSRAHVSTDYLLEYRVEVAPSALVALARSGIKGTHAESMDQAEHNDPLDPLSQGASHSPFKTPRNPPPDPKSVLRIWVPASILQQAVPALVQTYKATAKPPKLNQKRARAVPAPGTEENADFEEDERQGSQSPAAAASGTPPGTSVVSGVGSSSTMVCAEGPVNAGDPDASADSAQKVFRGSRLIRRLLHPSLASIPDLSMGPIDPSALSNLLPSSSNNLPATFMFTMPEPDNPCLVETDTDTDTETDVEDQNDAQSMMSQSVIEILPPPSSQPLSQPRSQLTNRASPPTLVLTGDEENRTLGCADGVADRMERVAPTPNVRTAREAQQKRPCQSQPIASTSALQITPKRRRVSDDVVLDNDVPVRSATSPCPFPIPRPNPPAWTSSGGMRPRRQIIDLGDVIDIASDSDGEQPRDTVTGVITAGRSAVAQPGILTGDPGRRRGRRGAALASSQGSDVIDLT